MVLLTPPISFCTYSQVHENSTLDEKIGSLGNYFLRAFFKDQATPFITLMSKSLFKEVCPSENSLYLPSRLVKQMPLFTPALESKVKVVMAVTCLLFVTFQVF